MGDERGKKCYYSLHPHRGGEEEEEEEVSGERGNYLKEGILVEEVGGEVVHHFHCQIVLCMSEIVAAQNACNKHEYEFVHPVYCKLFEYIHA
jgi:hypothetical protein